MADKKKVLEVTDRELAIIYVSVAHVNSHRYPELTVGCGQWRMHLVMNHEELSKLMGYVEQVGLDL